jgi:hypothetical protein
MVPSEAVRGSPVVHCDPQLVKMHAVALNEREAADLTACGRHD